MEQKTDVKIGLKSFLKTIILLYSVLIIVGILTYIIPAGQYAIDDLGKIIPNSFEFIEESITRVPWYRWLTAPIEGTILGDGNASLFQIFAMILLLGGCFKVLEDSGAIKSLIKAIINKFKDKRYLSVWIITFLMMSLSSFFGLQEELLILFPIFFSFAHAMNWSKITALNFVLITTGVGFTCALFNPFTVGLCSELAGTTILSGLWFRALIFIVFYITTSIYLVKFVKKEEKSISNTENNNLEIEISNDDKKKTTMILSLFAFVLLIVIIFTAIPLLRDLGLGLIIMGVAFLIGTLVIGRILLGNFKSWFLSFWKGVVAIAPSLFIMMTAFSIKYLADKANILHTLFYYIYGFLSNKSPYLSVLIIYLFVLGVEFFIPGSTAKAMLLIPLLTLAPIPGISVNIIILCYLFGDGYTNIIYPTCGTLVIGLGLADIGFLEWIKKNGFYMLFLVLGSALFLLLAVLLGL